MPKCQLLQSCNRSLVLLIIYQLFMEQINYLQKLFYIKYLPDLKLGDQTYKNSAILIISLAVFTLFNLLGFLYPISILIFGIVLPIWSLAKGQQMGGYFCLLSVLLWVRTWYPHLNSLDGAFVLCLWHPNLRWGDKILKQIKRFYKKDSLSSKISKAASKLAQ